jgi:hypothetical protein
MARTRLILVVTGWLLAAIMHMDPASAHQAPNSEAYLDFQADRVQLEIVIPAAEYAYASGESIAGGEESLAQARRYLAKSISAIGAAQMWQTRVESLEFVTRDGTTDLVAMLTLVPSDPSGLNSFTLRWRAVIGAVPDHFVLVMLRRDHATKLGEEPVVIGTLRGNRNGLPINRGAALRWMPFANAVSLGAAHILGGIDHLAFLLALLLPLPLIARSRRWHEARGAKPTIRAAAILISGFTAGHSATLIAASLGGLTLPSALVETLIAVSVLIAAIHAIRPIFPSREALFATLFGLVHGLGFAGFLSSTDLSVARNIVTLLGFNIGIELVQIAIALAIVPALVIIASTPIYQKLRAALAFFCCAIAAVWVVDRFAGLNEQFVVPFEGVVETSLMLVFVATLVAGFALSLHRAPLR